MTATARSSRLDLRVAPGEKEIIDRAAALAGSNTADFVRGTALAAARQAIRAHEAMALSAESSRVFVEALIDPPEPNGHLRALAREFRGQAGS
jgi:uncharacterized protein (DUF1778 family)